MQYDLGEINRLNFCECNCGEYAKLGNRFITGHNRRKHLKPIPNHHLCGCNKCDILVASDKIYAVGHSRKGKHCSKEHKQNLSKPRSEEAKKNMRVPKTEQGRLNIKAGANKPEVRASRSQSVTNSWLKPEVREKKLRSRSITNALPEVRAKHKQSCIEAQNRHEVKEANRQAQLIAQNKQEVKEREQQTLKIANAKPEVKERKSKAQKKLWSDPDHRAKQLLAIAKCCEIKPNNPETLINLMMQEYFTGWKYTGDYSVIINGKNPDFIDEGTKQIVEFYGDYWHDGEDPTDRAEIFTEAGYETCVIWENELNNLDNVIWKMKLFCGKEF